tara:strand:- start:843 stop:1064 length:222 start_codon:yes stop_codon:yes gene_type:complete
MVDLITNGNGGIMTPNEVRKHTISMYNEMIAYYKLNKGKQSKYGRTIITDELIFNMERRRSDLSMKMALKWGK